MKLKRMDPPREWRKLKAHKLAELTEFGVGIDLQDLAAHMMRNGYDQSEPIILFANEQGVLQILDGRHRLDAAVKAEVEPTFKEFDGSGNEALEWVTKKVLRQHLSASQRAMMAASIATTKVGSNGGLQNCRPENVNNHGIPEVSISESAAKYTVSERSVSTAKVVEEHCIPEIKTCIRKGQIAVSDAATVAKLSVKEQEKTLERFRLGKGPTLAKCKPKAKPKPKPKREVLTDALGTELPDSCRDAFADPALTDMIGLLSGIDSMYDINAWTKKAGSLTTHYGFILIDKFAEHIQESQHRLQLALEALKAGIPHAVCPKCNGVDSKSDGKTCRGCRGYGCVPEHRYQELTQ